MPAGPAPARRHRAHGAVPRGRRQPHVHLAELHRRRAAGSDGSTVAEETERCEHRRRERMLLGAVGAAGAGASPGARPAMAAEELRILAWQGYADDDWVKEFEKETGADVNVVFIGNRRRDLGQDQGQRRQGFRPLRGQHRPAPALHRCRPGHAARPRKLPNQKETLPRFRDLDEGRGRDARRQGLRHPVRLRFDRPHLRHRQGEDRRRPRWTCCGIPQYKGKVLAYDNGEHNFSFTALTMGIEIPFHLTDEQMQAGQGRS